MTRSATATAAGQSRPWFAAALLVMVGSVLVAAWLNATAENVDRDTLDRGADAIAANIEEQIQILELAGTGAQSLLGQSFVQLDLSQLVSQIDISVLRSLLAVATYPISEVGTGAGEFVRLEMVTIDFDVPLVALSRQEVDELLESGGAFFSAPIATSDPARLDYMVAVPVATEEGPQMVGVVFRPDTLLRVSVEGAGEGQYSAELVDIRYEDLVVATVGERGSNLKSRRSPDGAAVALAVVVRPGPDFPFAQSAWVPGLAIATGLLIALLLVWMARLVRARAAELEERLRLAQELNESKDRFLATVSHELRTPLTVVLGVASEVGPNWEALPMEDRLDLLAMMSEQAHEASNIVEDLLVAARSDPSQLRLAIEATDLRPHLEYAVASLPKPERHRIKWSGGGQVVEADTTRLRQIVRNLLENAVRYGGPEIEVRSWREEAQVWLTVSDNGVGLASKDLERIFEPYERSEHAEAESPSGVGIGLYVSRMLARLMGGDLDCLRPRGHTVFRLRLPAAVAAEPVKNPVRV